ncbi:MAG: TetR/AcrR family transcriptional regulator [Oscillospiraceae bacterium]
MKSSRRVKMTQTLLKQSLIELLEHKSIHQISIKEICERANVSRSTFYAYYGSQYELLNAIEREIIEETQMLASKETCHDEEHTKRLLEEHFQYTLDHIQALQAFSMGDAEDYMLPKRTMQIILLPYIDHKLMQRDPPVSAEEYEHMCLFSIFGCISVVKSWMLHPARFTPQALAEEMVRYVNAVVEVGSSAG